MKRIITRLIIGLALLAAIIVPASPALAATNLFGNACDDSRARSSVVCQTPNNGNPIWGPDGIIRKVTNVIAIIGGTVAVIILVLGGIRYIVSHGNADQVASAKRTILYAIVGLLIIALGQFIITFVIGRI